VFAVAKMTEAGSWTGTCLDPLIKYMKATFQGLTSASMQMAVFLVVASCSPVEV
jgi:hypothetical protein